MLKKKLALLGLNKGHESVLEIVLLDQPRLLTTPSTALCMYVVQLHMLELNNKGHQVATRLQAFAVDMAHCGNIMQLVCMGYVLLRAL